MSVNSASWLGNVGRALKSWLLEDPAVHGEVSNGNCLVYAAGFPGTAHNIVGRRVWVDDADDPAAISEDPYTITEYQLSTQVELSPAWPASADPGGYITFRLESRLAWYIRTRKGKFFWHDSEGSLPSSITAADMPSVEMIARGANGIRQQTNVDLQLTAMYHFTLAAAGKPLGELMHLYAMVHDRLVRGRVSRYGFDQAANGVGIGGSRPESLQFNQFNELEFRADGKGGPIATGYFNNCDFDWLIDLRRQPDMLA